MIRQYYFLLQVVIIHFIARCLIKLLRDAASFPLSLAHVVIFSHKTAFSFCVHYVERFAVLNEKLYCGCYKNERMFKNLVYIARVLDSVLRYRIACMYKSDLEST